MPRAPEGASCDSCGSGGEPCVIDGDSYICEDCRAFHERAIDAATVAVARAVVTQPKPVDDDEDSHKQWFVGLARAAVEGYFAYSDPENTTSINREES
jgi:hypothetical protein